ncbi:hypothetical protein J4526_06320 [Desulfurococcaceae archaeon MEX13E-LK6-19]|nr:hypothetical protein J4526_06320 [Desulfurococcaceae archaeon MEX13E-LK6-19]
MCVLDELVRNEVFSIIKEYGIDLGELVECQSLTGKDLELKREEYALVRGPEVLLSCRVKGAEGQAFTVAPKGYHGSLEDVLSLDLTSLWNRGIFYATVNAVARLAGIIDKSIHCSRDKPEYCATELAKYIMRKHGSSTRILHIGYHPSHVEELYKYFRSNLLVTDLRDDTIWRRKHGVLIYDGELNKNYIGLVDIVLVTGSAIVNNTIWDILKHASILGKKVVVYGVSALGALKIISRRIPLDIEVFCPYSR